MPYSPKWPPMANVWIVTADLAHDITSFPLADAEEAGTRLKGREAGI